MTFEDKIKTTYKEVTENSDASSKNLKSELKKINNDVEQSQSQSKKFDTINVRLYVYLWQTFPSHLKRITTLPCKVWMLKTATELALIIQSKVKQTD